MRWKTQDQSIFTKDTFIIDKEGNTWVRTSALPDLSQSMVLVQLVGDSSETADWMHMRQTATWLRLPVDSDWGNYSSITDNELWREKIAGLEAEAKDAAAMGAAAVPRTVVLPIYISPSHPGWKWTSPDDGPLWPDARPSRTQLTTAPRVQAGSDTPYDVTVRDYSTDPDGTEVERSGGYELYRNYYVSFNPDGSYTLQLAGDYAFQKDYRLPQGKICPSNEVLLPDGTCALPPGNPAAPSVVGSPTPIPQPTPAAGPDIGLFPTMAPTPVPPVPLGPLSPSPSGCSGIVNPAIDVCAEASSRALSLAGQVGPPPIVLHQNPTKGVVHVPSFFWVDPATYAGGPLADSSFAISLPWAYTETTDEHDPVTGAVVGQADTTITGTAHITLEVRYRPSRYVWEFGDGTTLETGSLGISYPQESDVQHIYQRSSLGQPDNEYRYGLNIDWTGDWQVSGDANGGGGLPAVHGAYTAQHEMRDVEQLLCPDTGCRESTP
jgi:hypothetical protein